MDESVFQGTKFTVISWIFICPAYTLSGIFIARVEGGVKYFINTRKVSIVIIEFNEEVGL